MKNKILFLIIGILIGAIIATIGFLIYEKNYTADVTENAEASEMPQDSNMLIERGNETASNNVTEENQNDIEEQDGNTPPEIPDNDGQQNDGSTPPDMPDGEQGMQNGNSTPPDKPDGDTNGAMPIGENEEEI